MFLNFNKLFPTLNVYTDLKSNINLSIYYKYLLIVLTFLKEHQHYRFKILSTISCIDFPELYHRFELRYVLMSIDFPFILNLNIKLSEFTNINSISILFKNSVWLEREIWDLFGIYFINNCDLRRILTDYGFPYHPLRKTFPLQGYIQVNYNYIKKKIYYINNNFSQIKSVKNLNNSWNNLC